MLCSVLLFWIHMDKQPPGKWWRHLVTPYLKCYECKDSASPLSCACVHSPAGGVWCSSEGSLGSLLPYSLTAMTRKRYVQNGLRWISTCSISPETLVILCQCPPSASSTSTTNSGEERQWAVKRSTNAIWGKWQDLERPSPFIGPLWSSPGVQLRVRLWFWISENFRCEGWSGRSEMEAEG